MDAQLMPNGILSQTREGLAVASAANKILFAGGYSGNNPWQYYSRVDIFDIVANSWSTAELSQPRARMTTAVSGNKIFFAGGSYNANESSRIDIYDAVNNTWTQAELSKARTLLTGASAGNKVLFAGGNLYM
jgi:N-acetylneuraminic acid mutarotase